MMGPGQQVIVQPAQGGRAGDAAQPEDGQPLDVGPQPEPGNEPGVERRHGHAGHRRNDQQVQIAAGQPGRLQGSAKRLLPEVGRLLDIAIVGQPDPARAAVLRQRQDDMAVIDAGVTVQPLEQRTLGRIEAAELGHLRSELGLRIPVHRKGGPHRHDPGHRGRLSTGTPP